MPRKKAHGGHGFGSAIIVPVTNVGASARVSGVTKGTKHRHRRSGSSQLVWRRLSIRLGISWYGGTSSVAWARQLGIPVGGLAELEAPLSKWGEPGVEGMTEIVQSEF